MKTMVRIFLFVIILFCALVGFSIGETSYFDQNGNPVSREDYEKISKKVANNPPAPARPPDTAQAKPKLVTTEQKQPVPLTKQPIPPIKQTQSESQEAIRKKILDAYSKIPPIIHTPESQSTYTQPVTPNHRSTTHKSKYLDDNQKSVTNGDRVACFDKNHVKDMEIFAGARDKASFESYVQTKKCLILKDGVSVTVMELPGMFGGYTKFAYQGVTLWTTYDGIRF